MKTDKIRIDEIQLNDDRSEGGQGDVESLARNMEKYGQINPITVVLLAGNSNIYRIVTGRRRVAAALFLGWEQIDANVATEDEIPDEEMYALSENAAREEMNAIDEGILYAKELKRGTPVEELAALFCRNKSTVYQRAKLATLVPEMRELYKVGKLDLHVAAMAADLPEDAQRTIAEKAGNYYVSAWEVKRVILNAHNDFLSALGGCEDCVSCKRRTHYSDKTLFPELSDDDDRCLDHECFCKKWGKIITDAYDEFFVRVYGKPEWDLMSKSRVVSSVDFPAGLKIGNIEVNSIDKENGETDISDEDLELQQALGEAGKTEIVPCWNGTEFAFAMLANEDDIDELMGKGEEEAESEWEKNRRERWEDIFKGLPDETRTKILADTSKASVTASKADDIFYKNLAEAVSTGAPDIENLAHARCVAFATITVGICCKTWVMEKFPEAGVEEKDSPSVIFDKFGALSDESLLGMMLRKEVGTYYFRPPMNGLESSEWTELMEKIGIDLIGLRDAAVAEAVGETEPTEDAETDLSVTNAAVAEMQGDIDGKTKVPVVCPPADTQGVVADEYDADEYEEETDDGGRDTWDEDESGVEDAD